MTFRARSQDPSQGRAVMDLRTKNALRSRSCIGSPSATMECEGLYSSRMMALVTSSLCQAGIVSGASSMSKRSLTMKDACLAATMRSRRSD